MEGYKDVMLSQAPAMYQKTAQSTNVTLENYKGILLCARPTNLPRGASTQLRGDAGGPPLLTASGQSAPAFVPGGAVDQPAGLGPSSEERATMERNKAKRAENYKTRRADAWTVLTRHKRWLRSFAAQVRRMKAEDIQHEIEMARRVERMRPAEAPKRPVPSAICAPAAQPPSAAPGNGERQKTCKAKKKPKWALTEDEALEDDLADAGDLLDFAKNLDFERFISDYEVAGALAIMRDRVHEIAKENHWTKEDILRAADYGLDVDEDEKEKENDVDVNPNPKQTPRDASARVRDGESGAPIRMCTAAAAKRAAHEREWDHSTSVGTVLTRAIMRDALQLAERLLAASASMRKIHTKYSLARILQRCVLNGGDVSEAMQRPSIHVGNLTNEPRVAKVHADATGFEGQAAGPEAVCAQRVLVDMQRSKERTQGLPYLYRCPAI